MSKKKKQKKRKAKQEDKTTAWELFTFCLMIGVTLTIFIGGGMWVISGYLPFAEAWGRFIGWFGLIGINCGMWLKSGLW